MDPIADSFSVQNSLRPIAPHGKHTVIVQFSPDREILVFYMLKPANFIVL